MTLPTQMSPYQVYSTAAGIATRSLVQEVVGTAFVYWLANAWRLGAQVVFLIFVLMTTLEALHVFWTRQAGKLAMSMAHEEGVRLDPDLKWLIRALYVRIGSLAVSIALLFVLFHRIWPA